MGDGGERDCKGDLVGTADAAATVGGATIGVADVGVAVGENVGGAAITKLFVLTSEVLTPVTVTVIPAALACFFRVCVKFFGEKDFDVVTMFPSKSDSGVSWWFTMLTWELKSIETGVLAASPLKWLRRFSSSEPFESPNNEAKTDCTLSLLCDLAVPFKLQLASEPKPCDFSCVVHIACLNASPSGELLVTALADFASKVIEREVPKLMTGNAWKLGVVVGLAVGVRTGARVSPSRRVGSSVGLILGSWEGASVG